MFVSMQALTFGGLVIPNAKPVLLDSFVVPGFLQTSLGVDAKGLFTTLEDTAPWTDPSNADFKYRGNELARRKAFLISSTDPIPKMDEEPSMLLWYGYPGGQYAALRHYRDMRTVPALDNFVERLKRDMIYNDQAVSVNHAILTCYRGADDNIGFHSDKPQNIRPGTPIISLSLGEKREFHFGTADPEDNKKTVTTHRFVLQSGDLFILGPRTNAAYRHAIVPVHQEKLIERDPEVDVGSRISIVLRDIATTITRENARKRAKRTEKARQLRNFAKSASKVKAKKGGRRNKQ